MERQSLLHLLVSSVPRALGVLVAFSGLQANAAPMIEVKVVPRVGLFSQFLYREIYAKGSSDASGCSIAAASKKMPWLKYYEALPVTLKDLFKLDGGVHAPTWDLLVTDAYSAANGEGCGYGIRRVRISVKGLSRKDQRCRFSIDPAGTYDSCTREFALTSNLRQSFTVDVEGEVNSIPAEIPEDFLIVSLGDSYASGEGNPDAPGGSAVAWSYYAKHSEKKGSAPPLWMDPWCHRSAWAGPIQAGMRLARERPSSLPAKHRASIEAGAITIASFACSGAKISEGVLSGYEGVQPLQKVFDTYPTDQNSGGYEFKMDTQLVQLKTFLDRQNNEQGKKTTIDLVTLSGGGNDLLFGPKLVEEILGPYFAPNKQERAAKSLQFTNFKQRLPGLYDDLDKKLADIGKPYSLRQAILTGYPDPFWVSEGQICEGQVTRKLWSRLPGAILRIGIDRDGAQSLKRDLFDVLNAEAMRPTRQWLTVDPTADIQKGSEDDVRQHGWCADGEVSLDYSTRRPRWFRDAEDSLELQRNLNGAFHPTWEAHTRLYAKRIYDTLVASLSADFTHADMEIDPPVGVGQDGRHYISSSSRAFSRRAVPGKYSIKVHLGSTVIEACPKGDENCAPVRLAVSDGEALTGRISARSLEYKRVYEERDLGTFVVDATPPRLICDGGAAETGICAGLQWTSAKFLKIDALEAGSGLRNGVSWAWYDERDNRISDGQAESLPQLLALSEGKPQLQICVQDRVGHFNSIGCGGTRLTIKVDRTPPKAVLRSVNGISVRLQEDGLPYGPIVLPAFAGSQLALQFNVNERDGSGVERIQQATKARNCDEDWFPPESLVKVPDSARAPFDSGLEFRDCAGNVAKPIRFFPLVKRLTAGIRSLDEWLAMNSGLPANSIQLGEFSLIGNLSDTSALLGLDEGRQRIAAAWLNLLDGRIDPFSPMKSLDEDFCGLKLGGLRPTTAYELLLRLDRCAANQDRAQNFIAELKNKLTEFGLSK